MSSKSNVKSKWERVEKTVGASAISLFIFLFVFWLADEFYGLFWLRHQDQLSYFKKEAYFEPRPFVAYGGSLDPNEQKSEGLNKLGYRGPVPTLPKPSSEYRVIVIGGSTVLIGSPSISELLESHFKSDGGSRVKVYNFGVAASTLRMDIARLVFEAGDYEPDLVVFYGGGNDLGMPYQSDPRPGFPPNFLSYEYNPLLLAGTKEQSLLTLLKLSLFHSKLVRKFVGEPLRESLVPLEATRQKVGWMSENWSTQVASTYLSDISRAEKTARGFSARAFFVFQPILAFKRSRTLSEDKWLEPSFLKHADHCRSLIAAGLLELQKSEGVTYADLSTIFDPVKEDVFYDGVHIRQEYFPLISQAVFHAMLKHFPEKKS